MGALGQLKGDQQSPLQPTHQGPDSQGDDASRGARGTHPPCCTHWPWVQHRVKGHASNRSRGAAGTHAHSDAQGTTGSRGPANAHALLRFWERCEEDCSVSQGLPRVQDNHLMRRGIQQSDGPLMHPMQAVRRAGHDAQHGHKDGRCYPDRAHWVTQRHCQK